MMRPSALLPLAILGCASPPAALFEEAPLSLAWPPPPQPARVRYVGELTGSDDLKRPDRAWEGVASFFLGDEPAGRFVGPRAVVRSADGRVLAVADPGDRCVHLLDLVDREYVAVRDADGDPLLSPVGLALGADGTFHACDSETGLVHRFRFADGSLVETLPLSGEIGRPVALAHDATADELYVVDVVRHDVKVVRDGRVVRTLGRRGAEPGAFNYPCDVALSRDAVWVADSGNQRVQGLTRDGAPITTIGRPGDAMGDLALPKCVALDGDGHVYVVDGRFENVQIFDREGRLLLFFGEEGSGPGEFWLPGGLHIDRSNRIWICDSYNGRLQVFDYLPAPEVNDAP